MEYYWVVKEWNIVVYSNMDDLENIILSEVSQTEKENLWYHLCVEYKKNNTNESIYKTEIDSQT